jgi:WD40 repeat protein
MREDAVMSEPAMDAIRQSDWQFDAYVVGVSWNACGDLACALGDGGIRVHEGMDTRPQAVSLGAEQPLAICPDCIPDSFLVGTEAGSLFQVNHGGATRIVRTPKPVLIDRVTSHPRGGRAAGIGRDVYVYDLQGRPQARLGPHPSSVGGVCFDPTGEQIAASHYGGVTVWSLARPDGPVRKFEFPGSHLDITWSPDGDYIATSTQEKEVHVWRTANQRDMRMSGYLAKVRSLAWSANAQWLFTSGAEAVIGWDFSGTGPEGRAPAMLGPSRDESIVMCVAAHPSKPLVALGYGDGSLWVSDTSQPDRNAQLSAPSGAGVTALAWSPDDRLACGRKDGTVLVLHLDRVAE